MARIPKGGPRSALDALGAHYEAMTWEQRLQKQHPAGASNGPSAAFNKAYFSPFASPVADLDLRARPDSAFRLGNKWFREIDNGVANVLQEVDDPMVSPLERAAQREAIARARFIADHPLGGLGYGLATLANASPRGRDAALAAGGLVDAVMSGAAPFGAAPQIRTPPPRADVRPTPVRRPQIRYQDLNARGQATGTTATITANMLGTGSRTDQNLRPPGLKGDTRRNNQARGHLLGKQLGGSGRTMRNLVTQTQTPSNDSWMQKFENHVARRVRDGEIIEFSARPFYNDGILPPESIFLTALGLNGVLTSRLVRNPAGQRK
ncbi:DNA/RNA non-specific endonuclease [Phenylobacterium sp.]|uniref:DNA/RNA non-specific endonuclease n=1 Tax=Phenylobacterium sp. TaxID=1871053 RepID=UPI0037C5349F